MLLAACSPYFHELLTSANCPHPVIVFKDYQFWELQALVAFMYSGEVNVPQSHLPWILRAAESLQIKGEHLKRRFRIYLATKDLVIKSNQSNIKFRILNFHLFQIKKLRCSTNHP